LYGNAVKSLRPITKSINSLKCPLASHNTLPTIMPLVKIFINALLGHVPSTVIGFVLKAWPFVGEVIIAG
jgi:hypothetical protein